MKSMYRICKVVGCLCLMLLACAPIVAQTVEYPCSKQMEKGQFDKAKEKLQKMLDKNPADCEANYAFAEYYFAQSNPEYSTLEAYRYILTAEQCFNNAEGKALATLNKHGYTAEVFGIKLSLICSFAAGMANKDGSVAAYNAFLRDYPRASDELKASVIGNRNFAAFRETEKVNTIAAYKQFMAEYPDAEQTPYAQKNIYRLAYQKAKKENTEQAYRNYIAEYPESPLVDDARREIENIQWEKYAKNYSDLKWACAMGPVRSIVEKIPEYLDYSERTIIYRFDQNGILTSITIDGQEWSVRRDSQGQITFVYIEVPCEPCGDDSSIQIGTEYSYGKNGNVIGETKAYEGCTEELAVKKIIPNGWKASAQRTAMGDCDDTQYNFTYKYSNRDAYNNWLQCRMEVEFENYEGVPMATDATITREIVYWK